MRKKRKFLLSPLRQKQLCLFLFWRGASCTRCQRKYLYVMIGKVRKRSICPSSMAAVCKTSFSANAKGPHPRNERNACRELPYMGRGATMPASRISCWKSANFMTLVSASFKLKMSFSLNRISEAVCTDRLLKKTCTRTIA